MTLAILRALFSLWPFIREMFFDGKSFFQVVRENKFVTALILALSISIGLNYIAFAKIHEIVVTRRDEPGGDTPSKVPVKPKPIPTEPVKPSPPASAPTERDEIQKRHDEDAERLNRLFGS